MLFTVLVQGRRETLKQASCAWQTKSCRPVHSWGKALQEENLEDRNMTQDSGFHHNRFQAIARRSMRKRGFGLI